MAKRATPPSFIWMHKRIKIVRTKLKGKDIQKRAMKKAGADYRKVKAKIGKVTATTPATDAYIKSL